MNSKNLTTMLLVYFWRKLQLLSIYIHEFSEKCTTHFYLKYFNSDIFSFDRATLIFLTLLVELLH